MQSQLPITGFCHYCEKPCTNRFCDGTSCQRLYWYHKNNPLAARRSKQRAKSSLTISERIEVIGKRNDEAEKITDIDVVRQYHVPYSGKITCRRLG